MPVECVWASEGTGRVGQGGNWRCQLGGFLSQGWGCAGMGVCALCCLLGSKPQHVCAYVCARVCVYLGYPSSRTPPTLPPAPSPVFSFLASRK